MKLGIFNKNWFKTGAVQINKPELGSSMTADTAKVGEVMAGKTSPIHLAGTLQKATFGAGCFWGVESDFRKVKGVVATAAGYEGGNYANPSYKDVCSHTTNHAEVVEIDFDPTVVTYDELLEVFWSIHDPTTPNRQGLDFGSQYRSVIFFHNSEQQTQATSLKEQLQKENRFRRPITTQITPATPFYRAEEYHQQYYDKSGVSGCHLG